MSADEIQSEREHIKVVNSHVAKWLHGMEASDFCAAAEISIESIAYHIARGNASEPCDRSYFGVRVFLNGLRDIANLSNIISHSNWLDNPKAVEVAWHLAHDACDRIWGYAVLDQAFVTFCAKPIRHVFDAVRSRYGPGLYLSTETLFDTLVCSICGEDVRGCDHIPGKWYKDELCQVEPIGLQPTAVALVENPRDPRCRIWPWVKCRDNENEHVLEDVPILIAFSPEGDDDGGKVIDVERLFGDVSLLPSESG